MTKNLDRLLTKGSKPERLLYHLIEREYGSQWLPTSHDAPLQLIAPQKPKTPRFRYDFTWDRERVTVEIQGGVFGGKSGHNTGVGIMRDMRKVNFAQLNNHLIFLIHGHASESEMLDFAAMVLGVVARIRGVKLTRKTHEIKPVPKLSVDKSHELSILEGLIWD